jgi:macrolide-specific efflux system membrane fusion protein
LPAGASADIEIVAASKDDVLAVPSRVVLGRGDSRYIYRAESGRSLKTPVTIGVGNYERTEVLSGLKEGDVVLYPSENAELVDNQKIIAKVSAWP